MSNKITLDLDSPDDISRLRKIIGVSAADQPRVEPATKPAWAPGPGGSGEWILAVAPDDFREHPIPYPVPRIVDVPDIYAPGMDQFSAVNNRTKRSVYESKGFLPVPESGSVTCPESEYVRLMDRYNQERLRSKKPGLPVKPNEIPGPWGNLKGEPRVKAKESGSGRA